MTDRQEKFVSEYLICGNATAAAISAGYSAKCANRQGFKLMGNTEVRAAIDAKINSLASEKIATTKEILETLTRILRRQEPEIVASAGKLITLQTPISHTLRAAYLLLKYYGEFREKPEVQTNAADILINALNAAWADDPPTVDIAVESCECGKSG